jgi:hypothetical protein
VGVSKVREKRIRWLHFSLGKVRVTIWGADWLKKKLVEEASYQTLIVGSIAHGEETRFLRAF